MFELSELLAREGHTVIPFSMASDQNRPTAYSKYFADKLDVKKFNFKNIIKTIWNYEAAAKLKKLIKQEKPDIAHLHNIHNHLSLSIIKILRQARVPIVMTLHDYKFICPNRMLYSRGQICRKCQGHKYYYCFLNKCVQNSRAKSFLGMLEAYLNNNILKMADKIDLFIAPSRFIKDIFMDFGFPKEKIKVIHNFIQHFPKYSTVSPREAEGGNKFSPRGLTPHGESAGFVKTSGFKKTEKSRQDYFLYFGRISEEKGIGALIEAVNRMDKKINLKLAGSGPDYNKFAERVKNLKLEKNIEFLGPRYNEKLDKLIANAKAIIIPSLWPENFPYAMLEALAGGKVIIASDIGGIPEMIKDNKTGYLFKPGDSDDLARKIEQINNSGNLGKVEENALAAAGKLNPSWHAKEIINLYKFFIK